MTIKADCQRFGGGKIFTTYLKSDIFKYVVWLRIGKMLIQKHSLLLLPIWLFVRIIHNMQCHSLGIQIDLKEDIGEGIKFMHYSNIVIHSKSIGKNCTIFQGVTIGNSFSKKTFGVPEIGDNVIVFSGAKVLGNIKIGNNVVIAANSVVLSDVPDNCIVGGVPAKIISNNLNSVIRNL